MFVFFYIQLFVVVVVLESLLFQSESRKNMYRDDQRSVLNFQHSVAPRVDFMDKTAIRGFGTAVQIELIK